MRQAGPHSDLDMFQQLYSKLEQLVVEGRHAECREVLDETHPQRIPRPWASRFGEIAFRMHNPGFTLKVLHRFIYPENPFDVPATDKEKTVYASALYTFGAINEAREILNSIRSQDEPEVWFHKAGASFCAWDYEAGIPYFRKYVESPKVDAYKRLVGKVNLAAGCIFVGDWEAATKLLEETKAECETNSYRLLLGNSFELLAQIQIFKGHYDQALQFLQSATDCLKDQGGFYALYAEKWTLIARCLKSSSPQNLESLRALREKALAIGHWNTVRECDLFEALATKNTELVRKVIMGTPYEPYRKRVRRLFETNFIAKGQYKLRLASEAVSDLDDQKNIPLFDPYKKGEAQEALYEKPMLLALYNALTEDFYHPANIGILFQKIYPKEKFNPYTSPARVLQLLRRLGKWFAENAHPIQVIFKKSEFRLTSTQPIYLTVQRGTHLTAAQGKIGELKNNFGARLFSTAEVCTTLGISKASANRLLSEAIKEGLVSKDKGRIGRTYRFSGRSSAQNRKRQAA